MGWRRRFLEMIFCNKTKTKKEKEKEREVGVVGCAAREKVRWWQWSVRIASLNVLELFVWEV